MKTQSMHEFDCYFHYPKKKEKAQQQSNKLMLCRTVDCIDIYIYFAIILK